MARCYTSIWDGFFLILIPLEVELARFRVTGALPRRTEGGSECRALPGTAGSLAARHQLKGVVWSAADYTVRVVGKCEDIVKEIHREGTFAVAWKPQISLLKS